MILKKEIEEKLFNLSTNYRHCYEYKFKNYYCEIEVCSNKHNNIIRTSDYIYDYYIYKYNKRYIPMSEIFLLDFLKDKLFLYSQLNFDQLVDLIYELEKIEKFKVWI